MPCSPSCGWSGPGCNRRRRTPTETRETMNRATWKCRGKKEDRRQKKSRKKGARTRKRKKEGKNETKTRCTPRTETTRVRTTWTEERLGAFLRRTCTGCKCRRTQNTDLRDADINLDRYAYPSFPNTAGCLAPPHLACHPVVGPSTTHRPNLQPVPVRLAHHSQAPSLSVKSQTERKVCIWGGLRWGRRASDEAMSGRSLPYATRENHGDANAVSFYCLFTRTGYKPAVHKAAYCLLHRVMSRQTRQHGNCSPRMREDGMRIYPRIVISPTFLSFFFFFFLFFFILFLFFLFFLLFLFLLFLFFLYIYIHIYYSFYFFAYSFFYTLPLFFSFSLIFF